MSTVFSVSTCPLSFFTYIIYVALEAAFEQQSFMPVLNSHHKKVALTNHLLLSARGLVIIKGLCQQGCAQICHFINNAIKLYILICHETCE